MRVVFHQGVAIGGVLETADDIFAIDAAGVAFGDDFKSPFDAVRAVMNRHAWGDDDRPKWRRTARHGQRRTEVDEVFG